jgi:hypothetical protein
VDKLRDCIYADRTDQRPPRSSRHPRCYRTGLPRTILVSIAADAAVGGRAVRDKRDEPSPEFDGRAGSGGSDPPAASAVGARPDATGDSDQPADGDVQHQRKGERGDQVPAAGPGEREQAE